MTCIVAIKDGHGGVVMGADSAVSAGDMVQQLAVPKIVQVGEMLIGGAGELLPIQRILTGFRPPRQKPAQKDAYVFMVQEMVPALSRFFNGPSRGERSRGGKRKRHRNCDVHDHHDHDRDDDPNMTLIVAYRGKIFVVSFDGAVVEVARNYIAIGSGQMFAYGALAALELAGIDDQVPAPKRALIALEAAATFSSSVQGPYLLMGDSESLKDPPAKKAAKRQTTKQSVSHKARRKVPVHRRRSR